jgi:hypothetical protein
MMFVPITVAAALVHRAHAASGIRNSDRVFMTLF